MRKSQKFLRKSCLLAICFIALLSLSFPQANATKNPSLKRSEKFSFDGSISRKVLENYLDRSITLGYFLVPEKPEGYEFPYREDDIRMIKNMGAKFIGRAIYRWGEESKFNDPEFFTYAKGLIDKLHAFDPEIIFQGWLFAGRNH